MAGIAWVNGRIVEADTPAVAATDRGFMYGEGLFETVRAYGGRIFRLEQHLARMWQAVCELNLGAQASRLPQAVCETLAASGLRDAVVRITITPDTSVVLVRPLSLPPPEQYERGCLAITVPAAIVPTSPLRRLKSLNYLDKLLAQREAEAAGAHEAILVDPDGCIVEAARRNVFAVIGGSAVTPPLSRGLLPGITRAAVMQAAARIGLACEERDITREELLGAEECFLTSSVAEILPVASVDGTASCAPGPVTAALTKAYRALVAEELNLPG
jgi:branched-chain amino acid aminotransferase